MKTLKHNFLSKLSDSWVEGCISYLLLLNRLPYNLVWSNKNVWSHNFWGSGIQECLTEWMWLTSSPPIPTEWVIHQRQQGERPRALPGLHSSGTHPHFGHSLLTRSTSQSAQRGGSGIHPLKGGYMFKSLWTYLKPLPPKFSLTYCCMEVCIISVRGTCLK